MVIIYITRKRTISFFLFCVPTDIQSTPSINIDSIIYNSRGNFLLVIKTNESKAEEERERGREREKNTAIESCWYCAIVQRIIAHGWECYHSRWIKPLDLTISGRFLYDTFPFAAIASKAIPLCSRLLGNEWNGGHGYCTRMCVQSKAQPTMVTMIIVIFLVIEASNASNPSSIGPIKSKIIGSNAADSKKTENKLTMHRTHITSWLLVHVHVRRHHAIPMAKRRSLL